MDQSSTVPKSIYKDKEYLKHLLDLDLTLLSSLVGVVKNKGRELGLEIWTKVLSYFISWKLEHFKIQKSLPEVTRSELFRII